MVMKNKRRLARRPPDPPEGMMWWHGELWTIAAVESLAKHVMGNHDFQPRHKRDRANGITRYFKSNNELPSKKQRPDRRLSAPSPARPRSSARLARPSNV